jgi:hypothetical protein
MASLQTGQQGAWKTQISDPLIDGANCSRWLMEELMFQHRPAISLGSVLSRRKRFLIAHVRTVSGLRTTLHQLRLIERFQSNFGDADSWEVVFRLPDAWARTLGLSCTQSSPSSVADCLASWSRRLALVQDVLRGSTDRMDHCRSIHRYRKIPQLFR